VTACFQWSRITKVFAMKSLELWYLPYPDKMMPCHLWQSLLLLSSSSASRINRKASSMYVFLASFGVEAASAIHVAAQRHLVHTEANRPSSKFKFAYQRGCKQHERPAKSHSHPCGKSQRGLWPSCTRLLGRIWFGTRAFRLGNEFAPTFAA
jgi:hypothetical protein